MGLHKDLCFNATVNEKYKFNTCLQLIVDSEDIPTDHCFYQISILSAII